MLPRWHIFYGAIFSILLWIVVPGVNPFYIGLVFLSSFLIDFDHYMASAFKSGRLLSLGESFEYHREIQRQEREDISGGINRKGDFHLFHTLEFHLFVGLLGLVWVGFFYIFIGMVFHSLLDVFDGVRRGWLHRREFFLINWVGKENFAKLPKVL